MTLTAVSLFSGAGGFCEGVRLAGWDVVCAVESDAQACLTHAANFSDVALYKGDIARFLEDEQSGVPSLHELTARKIDMVYGGADGPGAQLSPVRFRTACGGCEILRRGVAHCKGPASARSEILPNSVRYSPVRSAAFRAITSAAESRV